MTTVDEGYRHCEALTRVRAKNFYFGIRLQSSDQRRAMCAVYGFARRVDDIGDGDLSIAEKRLRLGAARAALAAPEPAANDAVLVALDDARRRFELPIDALVDLIDGVTMDVAGTRYERFEDLVVYCRRVAGSIGRLLLAIFGRSHVPGAVALSDDLGVALQLTNILRDLREDLELGRMYLPAEDLRRFGCEDIIDADPADLAELVRFEAARARAWFDQGEGLLALLDRRSASCAGTMSGVYGRILARIEANPTAVLHRRISLPAWEKTWIAARSVVAAR